MAEHEQKGPVPLKAVHIDLEDRTLTLIAADLAATRLTFSRKGILYQLLQSQELTEGEQTEAPAVPAEELMPPPRSGPIPKDRELPEDWPVQRDYSRTTSKEATVTLSGRLKSDPKEGKADRQGKPTAWATMAAHIEGREQAELLSVTFHGRTRTIALGLLKDDPITAKGYLHHASQEGRLRSFSVLTLLHHPDRSARVQS